MKLYVGNLSYNTTEETLKTLFSNYADVASVQIMRDRFTQQSKGFGFIEIEDEIKAQRAIGGMNGKEVDGRRIRVSEAVEKPRIERNERGFDDGYRSRPHDYDRNYERRDYGRSYERRDSDYRNSRDSERHSFDRRGSDERRSGGYGRRSDDRGGRYSSDRNRNDNYRRFSRRDDNPDEY